STSARDAAASAEAAGPRTESEPRSQSDETHIDTLSGTKKGQLQQPPFLALVNMKLATMHTPKTLGEMDDFKESGGAAELKAGLDGNVKGQVAGAKKNLQTTPDTPAPTPALRKETPLGPIPKTPASAALSAREATPAARAAEEGTLEASPAAVGGGLPQHP